jgi:hypothetical protein
MIPAQTFGFDNSVDLVWKLYWEITRLHEATPHDPIDMKCFAFNAAVTAWHLADWVFEDMTLTQRGRHQVKSLCQPRRIVLREPTRPVVGVALSHQGNDGANPWLRAGPRSLRIEKEGAAYFSEYQLPRPTAQRSSKRTTIT